MIISTNNTFYNQNLSINRTQNINNTNKTIFCGVNNVDIIEPLYSKALSKFKKFSISEYKTLTEPEKIRLRKEYKNMISNKDSKVEVFGYTLSKVDAPFKFTEDFHDKVAQSIADNFDNKYGKGKYTVIIIGRSVSSVGKVLGYKIGEENVKNIPMSAAKRYLNKDIINTIKKNNALGELREYINSIGLNKEKIQASNKKYIVIDYCMSGESLKGATALLKRDDVLGQKNIVAKDVLKCIKDKKLRECARGRFFECYFKNMSFVERTYNLSYIKSFETNTSQKNNSVRLTWFKLLDNEMLNKQNKKTDSEQSLFSKIKKIFNIF